MHILLLAWLFFQNIKNKTWRQLPKYYPNLLYVVFFNLLYYSLVNKKLMWVLKSNVFNDKTLTIIHACGINPCLILLYLANSPNTFLKQFIYVNRWIIISTMVEWIFKKCKKIAFYHGWNIGWSMMIYINMYLLSLLLNKKPILTLLLSLTTTMSLLFKFKIPVRKNFRKQLRKWM